MWLEKMNIVHRDISPGNIILAEHHENEKEGPFGCVIDLEYASVCAVRISEYTSRDTLCNPVQEPSRAQDLEDKEASTRLPDVCAFPACAFRFADNSPHE